LSNQLQFHVFDPLHLHSINHVFQWFESPIHRRMSPKINASPTQKTAFERWQSYCVYFVTLALVASGLIWLALDNFRGESLPQPMQAWALRLHGTAAAIAGFIYGMLIAMHVRVGWVLRRNRALGVTLCTLIVLLVLTGLSLYYLPGERSHAIASILHWVLGISMPIALVIHVVRGRRPHYLNNAL
jgi:hypothetical protein